MSFSTCKYDRELQFFWSKIGNLRTQLESIDDTKGSVKDKKLASIRIEEINKEIEALSKLQHDIEQTYLEADMSDYLDEMRSRGKTPASKSIPFEYKEEKVEVNDESGDINAIASINAEISELETSLAMAQINNDTENCNKIQMSLSALKSRRYDLIEMMKSEKSVVVETSNEDIEEMKRDIASLRTQLSNLRVDMLDLKEMVMRTLDHLGLERNF